MKGQNSVSEIARRYDGHSLTSSGTILDRLIVCEVEEPREFPPRLVRPRCATRAEDSRVPGHEPEEARQPREGPALLGCRHRDGLDRLARMGRRDELVHDDLDVGVVSRRDDGPAHNQGGRARLFRRTG
jgi:hypothetical protein